MENILHSGSAVFWWNFQVKGSIRPNLLPGMSWSEWHRGILSAFQPWRKKKHYSLLWSSKMLPVNGSKQQAHAFLFWVDYIHGSVFHNLLKQLWTIIWKEVKRLSSNCWTPALLTFQTGCCRAWGSDTDLHQAETALCMQALLPKLNQFRVMILAELDTILYQISRKWASHDLGHPGSPNILMDVHLPLHSKIQSYGLSSWHWCTDFVVTTLPCAGRDSPGVCIIQIPQTKRLLLSMRVLAATPVNKNRWLQARSVPYQQFLESSDRFPSPCMRGLCSSESFSWPVQGKVSESDPLASALKVTVMPNLNDKEENASPDQRLPQ